MSADLGALSERHERRQSFELGAPVVPPPRVEWSPPTTCEAQRAPLEDCGHVGDVELTLIVHDADETPREPSRRVVVCTSHRHAAEVVLLATVPRNRVVTLTLRPIETVKGLSPCSAT